MTEEQVWRDCEACKRPTARVVLLFEQAGKRGRLPGVYGRKCARMVADVRAQHGRRTFGTRKEMTPRPYRTVAL